MTVGLMDPAALTVIPRQVAAPVGLWGTAEWDDVPITAVWMGYAEPYELVWGEW